eukprot:IDg792t1
MSQSNARTSPSGHCVAAATETPHRPYRRYIDQPNCNNNTPSKFLAPLTRMRSTVRRECPPAVTRAGAHPNGTPVIQRTLFALLKPLTTSSRLACVSQITLKFSEIAAAHSLMD